MSDPFVQELFKAWHIVALSMGVFAGLNLLLTQRGTRNINLTLLVYVTVLLVPSLSAYIQLISNKPPLWLTQLSQNLTWAYGPLLYAITQQSLKSSLPKKAIALHLLPFLIVVSYQLLLSSTVQIPTVILLAALFTQIFIYTTYCAIHVFRNKTRILNLLQYHPNSTYYWLLYLALGLLLLTAMDATIITLLYTGYSPDFLWLSIIAGAISLYVSIICLFSLYQPHFLFTRVANSEKQEPVDSRKNSVRNIELSSAAAEELNQKLKKLVTTTNFHLDDEISLPKLAALLGVSRNQLSELFNVHKEITFYDYLNNLRFEEAKNLFNSNSSHLSVADIAYQSGFNSRNTFYKVFKQKTGVTPSQYRKTVKQVGNLSPVD